ncbi:GntR family transcriptional regulator [Paraburkholderia guartelaensis]|uniref:GntR family transcriptional regulator n=1 Tax=Paraburkholderia guartelaensis TaxID=2546446 RepID=A0A4V2ZV58_9BURK|nr:GntR family transcriptional regulator [Paraburkholderia guartelaensis]TDG03514.1 GntR family transcriptional regulator [Paraburkholderia guartelaensis]
MTFQASIVRTIRQVIGEEIVAGALSGGARLRQSELASRFKTSPQPVREALRLLEGDGLVVLQPNRGVTVCSYTTKDFTEMQQVRAALEIGAARLALRFWTGRDCEALDGALKSFPHDGDLPQLVTYYASFHELLSRPSCNSRLQSQIMNLAKASALAVLSRSRDRSALCASFHRDHQAIYRFWLDRDSKAVVAEIDSHMLSFADRFRAASRELERWQQS